MNKYIIKKCPFLSTAEYPNGNVETDLCGCTILEYCQDNDNCLLKQITELCNEEINDVICLETSGIILAEKILNKLEIEVINDK